MFKLLIFSISCVLFLSGCSGKKNEPRRAKATITKPGASSPGPVVEVKTSKNPDSAATSETGSTKKDEDSVVLPPPGEPVSDSNTNTTASETKNVPKALPVQDTAPVGQPQVAPTAPAPAATTVTLNEKATATPQPENKGAVSTTGANVLEKSGAKTEPKAEGQKAESDNSVVLNFEETKNLNLTMRSQLSDNSFRSVTTPVIPENLNDDDLDIRFEGTFDKPVYSVLNKSEKLVEFKDFSFSPAKQTKAKSGDYNLLGICVGAKCEVVFVAVYRIEKGKLTENYPANLKWTGERYVTAHNMDAVQFTEELQKQPKSSEVAPENKEQNEAEKISKAPPQLRVKYLLENSFKSLFDSLVKRLDTRMKKDDAIYSGRFFYNIKAGSFDWVLKQKSKEATSLNLKIEFVPTEKKEAVEFNGPITPKGVRLTDKSGITLDIYPVVANEFYLMVFESQKFQSHLPNTTKAIQAYGCQVLVEENETYSECEPLASTYVLGISALEGRIGGPVFHNTDKQGKPMITEKYKPESFEEMQKQTAVKK